MPDEEPEKDSVAYEVVVTVLFAVAIGLNVYLIVDTMTDGNLSRSIAVKQQHLHYRVSEWSKHRKAVRRDVGKVLWQATNIVEGNEQ